MAFSIAKDISEIDNPLQGINFEDKKYLITGGAGFLGSWIIQVLINHGAWVTCIDNLSSGLRKNVVPFIKNKKFRFLEHDISYPVSLHEPYDYVMHLASRASPLEFSKYPIEILRSNILGTMNVLEIAKKTKARVLFASTSEVYGNTHVIPTPETYHGYVNPIGIRSCYDEGKRAGEALCIAYAREHNLDIRIARIFNTYGPRMRHEGHYGRVIPRFITQALANTPLTIFGDGTQTRSFCYVTDQIEGLLRLISYESKGEVIMNIGNPEEISILNLAQCINNITRSSSNLEFHPLPMDDPQRRKPDITMAKTLLNWTPKIALNKGLERTIEYYKEGR